MLIVEIVILTLARMADTFSTFEWDWHILLTLTTGIFSAKILDGGMAEWSKAAVLKIVECNSSVGSNPTPTAIQLYYEIRFIGGMLEWPNRAAC